MANARDSDPSLGYLTKKETEVKLPRPTRVKNKTPAPIQITAEQILREARERQEAEIRPPKQKITDATELGDYRLRKRKEFEDLIRRVRWNKSVWVKYAKWEESQKDYARARSVWERALEVDYRDHTLWLKYADFEMKNKFVNHARNVWDRATQLLPEWISCDKLGDDEEAEELFVAFAEFEEKCKETERARCIYKYALDHIPKGRAEELYKKFVAFEKQYGDREGIEDAIVGKRRFQYEDEVRKNPLNYDAWFDYIRINYALYEELDAQDVDRTRDVYNLCLKTIPHNKFSFAKIWLMAAQFEIRQLNIDRARRILGSAIGMAPKDKIFKKYIEIELQLGNIERCRKLYEKYLEWSPENCYAWSKFAELERSLAETERARALFELAIDQPALDMPELLWKAYIDFEISEAEYERTRALYERLLDRTKHLKVWISYAKFEASAMDEGLQESDLRESDHEQKRKCLQRARAVFERALSYFRTSAPELKEERAMLLEEWLNMESSFGEVGDVDLVRAKLPKKLKKRRQIETEDGPTGICAIYIRTGIVYLLKLIETKLLAAATNSDIAITCRYEEYIDYLFPEETQTTNLKILEAAYKWKKQKIASDDD
ncbi:UNVERIFIED_CONTAM: Pre-splicing factor CLF1 [Sesamum radiatum]|uniref:Pre-splicing factor CLF1 n=1 Tax=Sesamum radiatum TaxID=300843 RepID=A0AAW2WKH4_SESRA